MRALGEDPIFHRVEPARGGSTGTAMLWQYFLLPVLIVAAAVTVFVLVGLLAGSEPGPQELLERVRTGSGNERARSATQLGVLIARERRRVDRGEAPDRPPFYADAAFREGLRDAARSSRAADDSESLRSAMLLMLGWARDAGAFGILEEILLAEGKAAEPAAVRASAAESLFQMGASLEEAPRSRDLFVRLTQDGDPTVRAVAHLAFARLLDPEVRGGFAPTPEVRDALRAGLDDSDPVVNMNAAVAAAIAGDGAAAPIVERSLERETLREMGLTVDNQERALVNLMRAARALGTAPLRARVEALTRPSEGNERVREKAREALQRWRNG